MGALAINFWMAGKWYMADVGNVQFILVNTWYGQFMHSPLEEGNFLAFHVSPFLFLLMPLVWLSAYPIPLVLSYQLALALTPIPIDAISRQAGLHPAIALALGLWFICNTFVGSLQLANHFESFYVLFALATMASIGGRRRHAWWVFAVLALSVKEDAAAWLFGFALWGVFFGRDFIDRRRAATLALICLAWGLLALGILAFSAQETATNASRYIDRMGGISVGSDNLWVFFLLIASAGGLCLLNWRAALLLLIPIPIILGNFMFTRQLLYYYSYPFLPFLAFATIAGVATVHSVLRKRSAGVRFIPAASIFIVALGIAQYPLPTRTDDFRRFPVEVTPRDHMRRHVAQKALSPAAPLALQFGLWGITPWRPDTVFLNENQLRDHHYIFMDLYGVHGLSSEENIRLMTRLRDEVAEGKRTTLYDSYDFVILSPASDNATSATKICTVNWFVAL